MSLLVVAGLKKSFGGNIAVDSVSFELAAGELLALIGPNGAGKSTIFNMIGGQLAADSGSIILSGTKLLGLPSRKIAQMGVGRTFQIAATFSSMTVMENIQMALLAHHAKVYSFWPPAHKAYQLDARELLIQVGMQEHADRPCRELAYGDVKRVELAMGLANDPKLLLMDEPTAGMAPQERHALFSLIRSLAAKRKMAILFTEHSMDVVFAYADRIIVLARGGLIAQGSAQEVRNNSKVQEVYLGTGKTFEAPVLGATL
ncbi:MAG: ABC transporter ATP-binding protein [Paralcaligenes sp.]